LYYLLVGCVDGKGWGTLIEDILPLYDISMKCQTVMISFRDQKLKGATEKLFLTPKTIFFKEILVCIIVPASAPSQLIPIKVF